MKYLVLIFMTSTLMSCEKTPYYQDVQVVDPLGWNYNDKKTFNIEVEDNSIYYDMHMIINHSKSYSYQNMYMKVTTSFPNMEDREEQLNIDLAEKNGEWIGNCNAEICHVKVFLLEKFKFQSSGKYSFTFEQFGRDVSLQGIEQLELNLFTTENN